MADLHASWHAYLADELRKDYMLDLRRFLVAESKTARVFPPGDRVFAALNATPFDEVRCVILGQDPYHGMGQANGLAFSVNRDVVVPPSLKNILKEVNTSCGHAIPTHGDLTCWADQGVLLLNTTLTVRERTPESHRGHGWERLTDRIIWLLNEFRSNIVFMLWGKHAQQKIGYIDESKHYVLTAPHPSPFSAHRGFFGCDHFSLANVYLAQHSVPLIDWEIT